MRNTRWPVVRIFLLLLFVSSHVLLIGCNDPSRTTGTMIEISDAVKAQHEKKLEKMKKMREEKAAAKAGKKAKARVQ
jgi:hypothetical protein